MENPTDRQILVNLFECLNIDVAIKDTSIYAAYRRFIFDENDEIVSVIDYAQKTAKWQKP